jgi:hypothetical protein
MSPDRAEQPSAQDVIDALRMALLAQDDPQRALPLVEALVEMAPETQSDRGVQMLIELIAEGSLKVELTDV